MSDELKPCPMCGSSTIMYGLMSGYALWQVVCRDCGIQARGRNKYAAINLWNTRPLEDTLRAELAAAQAEVERMRCDLKNITDIGGYWDALGILTLDEARVFDDARRALEAQ